MRFRNENESPGFAPAASRRRQLWLSFLAAVSLCFALFTVIPAPASAQFPDKPAATADSAITADSGSTEFHRHRRFGWSRYTDEEIEHLPKEQLSRHPMLYWRWWSNQRPKPVLCFVLMLSFSLIAVHFMPGKLAPAVEFSQNNFWRAMCRGIFFCFIDLTLIRPLFITEICTPLAFLLLALLQLLMLLGVAVVAHMLGNKVMALLRLDRSKFLSSHQTWQRSISVVIGALLLTFVLLIPGIGHLPRLGVRLVALLSLLGMGGLLRTRLGFKQP